MNPLPIALVVALLLGGAKELAGQSAPDSIPGAEAVLQPGAVVIAGELHGSREIPRLFGDLVASAAQKAPVLVALEIDRRERARVADFLGSHGSTQDRNALLSGDFWTDPYAADRPGSITLALTGNFHSRVRPGLPWDPSFEPMALLVRRELRTRGVVGLDSRYPPGTAWMCTPSNDGGCGVRQVEGLGEPSALPAVVLAPDLERYDGYIVVGRLTASPPARDVR